MDDFMFSFERRHDEEIMDYDTRFDQELSRAEQVVGRLSEMWKAHLYLKKMRIGPEKESLVLTGALGKYTVSDLRKSALSAFPSMGSLRKSHDRPATATGKAWHSGGQFKNGPTEICQKNAHTYGFIED